ncbi:MAG: glycosyltransferase family 2 protein, partial [Planctomycetota bacterium]
MSNDAGLRPQGFGGIIDCWQELLPEDGSVLRLPLQGVRDGPFLRMPANDAAYDVILVESLTESLGHLEEFVKEAASRLVPHGALMIDMENLAAPRSVRFALEGRPGVMDPAGSSRQPERRVHKRRVLAALAAAGLLLEEVYEVPSRPEEIGPEFMRNIFREGFLALSYVGGPPPARLWIVAKKQDPRQGTVLVGAGSAEQQRRTMQCLETLLPSSWQVLACHGHGDDREAQAFNRGIVQSQGHLLWFLRAGTIVDSTLFHNLVARTVMSPAAPAREDGGELVSPGDVSGLMVLRTILFQTGPLPREWRSDQIAYEDWCLRLEAITHNVHGVPGAYINTVPAPVEAETFTAESEQLIARWAAIEKDESGHASRDDPRAQANGDHVTPWAGREPRISLCMIVKDEESFLDACLRSAAPCVDDMVIVDTGSTDRTVEIAEAHGAMVFHFEWCDDFAAARNFALEHATGDWVL